MIWEISHNREQKTTQTSKDFSPFSHKCAFRTAVDKFFTSIYLYPSLSLVLKVYSSSELSKGSSSSAYLIFFLEEPKFLQSQSRRADFHPGRCSEMRRRFRQQQQRFLHTLLLISPSRKIYLSFLLVNRSTFLSDHFR